MCGFVGFTGEIDDKKAINDMTEAIRHRGPDSDGFYGDGRVTLGFRRLSLIDITQSGDQPIFNEDKTIVVMLNGEIYNYAQIRKELEQKGHSFYTNTDTETLVHLYEEYGENMLNKLRGMFAFVIYDARDESGAKLFLARDFFGIKPLYYGTFGGHLLFGSEIKAFLKFPAFEKALNEEALEQYMSFQCSVLDETFFKGVYKLPPGHYMTASAFEGAAPEIKITRYFTPSFAPLKNGEISEEQAADDIERAVLGSVEAHKVSDVEVGSFLSSGVDSSFVAAAFHGDKTFSVGFDYEKYNETEYAKELSDIVNIKNYREIIRTEDYWAALPDVMYHMDEPLADPSAVALWFVARLASKHVKAALSGEGADEFFGGYNIYREPLDIKWLTNLPLPIRKAMAGIAKALPFKFKGKNLLIRASKPIEQRFIGGANIFSKKERDKILLNGGGKSPQDVCAGVYAEAAAEGAANGAPYDDVTKMQRLDMSVWLVSDILLKADKMSMAHSIEVRVPFLDKDVFATARRLPANLRVNKKATKYAFRKAAGRHVPQAVADKKKLGFPVPIRIWLRDDKYYGIVRGAFEGPAARKFFNQVEILKLLERHKRGKEDNSRKIWAVYIFLLWHGIFFE